MLEGTLTLLLGDPPERVDVAAGRRGRRSRPAPRCRCATKATAEVVVFAYGAPPVTGQAEHLDDVEL